LVHYAESNNPWFTFASKAGYDLGLLPLSYRFSIMQHALESAATALVLAAGLNYNDWCKNIFKRRVRRCEASDAIADCVGINVVTN